MRRRVLLASSIGFAASMSGCLGLGGNDVLPGGDSESEPERDTTPERDTDGGVGEQDSNNSEGRGQESGEQEGEGGSEGDGQSSVTLESNDPITVVETFYDALYAPDVEMANQLLHTESPAPMYTDEVVSSFEEFNHELEEVVLAEESDSSAIVEFVLVLSGSDGVVRRNEITLEVRLDGDNWKVWEMRR